jgi:hypothetical protein
MLFDFATKVTQLSVTNPPSFGVAQFVPECQLRYSLKKVAHFPPEQVAHFAPE